MKIGVIGPGAIGCLFGALFSRAGHEVWVLDHRPERAQLLDRQGILGHDPNGQDWRAQVRATADAVRIGPVPLALLCVKSAAVAEAVAAARPMLGNKTLVVALQNGLGHHPVLDAALPFWALGITSQGANISGPGHLIRGGQGPTLLGFLAPAPDWAWARLTETVAMLSQAGLPAELSPDIRAAAWNKLIVNAGINALTALENCPNGELLKRPAALALMTEATREAARVARQSGVSINADPLAMTLAVCRATAANRSSMLQDVRSGRPTEVAAINGEVVRRGQELGIATPANELLLARVLALRA